MGFWSRLFGSGDDSGEISGLADEVDRYADRFANARDRRNAALARDYAARIRECRDLKGAKRLYREFLAIIEKEDYDPDDRFRQRDHDPDRYRLETDDQESYSDDS